MSITLGRESETIDPNRQYFFIYEGEHTEPDYFKGIKRHRKELGIKELMTLEDIGRPELEWHTTKITTLIQIANSYSKTFSNSSNFLYHSTYFLILIFEPYCRDCRENMWYKKYTKEYEDYLDDVVHPLRDEIERELEMKKIIDEFGYVTDIYNAIKYCKGRILGAFNYDITGKIRVTEPKKNTVNKGDQICIIHDRDYHWKHFPDSLYEDALKRIDKLNRQNRAVYRLIITYPKFEFWLLLHKRGWIPNIKELSRYPAAGNKCSEQFNIEYSAILGEDGKIISDDDFDYCFFNNIGYAIAQSKKYSTNPKELMSELGTGMGILLSEIIDMRKV